MENNYYLCDECTDNHKVRYTYVRYPFDNMLAHVFSVFDYEDDFNPDAFILEKSYLFSFIRKKFNLNRCIFLYYDYFMDAILDNSISELAAFKKELIIMTTYYAKF